MSEQDSGNNEVVTQDKPSSCEISINAKGQFSGKVKAYAADVKEAYDEAVTQAELLESYIRKKNFGDQGGDKSA